MQYRILGPVEIDDSGGLVDVGRGKQRALLLILLLHANRVVASDRLVEALWKGRNPSAPSSSLHVLVSQLRRMLPKGATRILTREPGYVLTLLEDDDVDAMLFEEALADGLRALDSNQLERAETRLQTATQFWRETRSRSTHTRTGPKMRSPASTSFESTVRRKG